MFRLLLPALLGLGVLAGSAVSPAQDKKDAPKKKERVAVADPSKAAADPDFAIQGEYVGEIPGHGKVGAQVVARGHGEFVVKAYHGGLPGDGADMKDVITGTAVTKDGKVVAAMKKGAETSTAVIGGGEIKVAVGPDTITLKKVERKSPTLGLKAPEGAVVLFGAPGDEKNWNGGKLAKLSDGEFLDVGVTSKQAFGAFKAHVEFRLPWMPNSTGQGRGNSGVYLQNRYECQVLDSFGLSGENNECGGIYTQHKPRVNMCLPPLVWQTYDLEFTPAVFGADGKKTANARATIRHNGVLIHDNVEFPRECPGGQPERPTPGVFQFQNHSDPVVFRNVWVVEVR
ncbi:DUF1080 domain-containing protein [bacterium]|nr:DUF1080 domain-containing protein [bacterium]